MDINVYVESRMLLEQLANSLYDRDTKAEQPVFFSVKEAHIVEKWINKLLDNIQVEK